MAFDARSENFLMDLIKAPSPSGFEELARKVWRDEIRHFSHEQFTDVHGSEIATIRGTSQKTSFLLMGHIDEIGLIVRYIDDTGLLYFAPVGGLEAANCVNQRVRLLTASGIVEGVIGKIAWHLLNESERANNKYEYHDLWIDIGATTKAEAEGIAPIGTPGVVGGDVVRLRNGRFAARDVDNKFGAFVVAEVMRRLWATKDTLFPTIHGVACVQEETTFTGSTAVGYRLDPTAAIAIDVNHSMDVPGHDKRRFGDAAMGKGAILTVGVKSNNRLVAAVKKAAADAGLTLQLEFENGRHGTDADPMATIRQGIPAISIGNPLRYMHSSVEVAQLSDIEAVVDVVEAFLRSVTAEVDYTP